jgi:signal peptidase I
MQSSFEGLRGWLATLPDSLANISIKWVLVAVGILLVLRMSMARGRPAARQASDSASEFLESALIAIVLVFLVIRPCVVQAFYIPSSSMEPTLLIGDRILVNKFIYRFTKPGRGEVAVFQAPPEASRGIGMSLSGNGRDQEQKDFIKRIIGLPGDTIEVLPTRVLVDGKPVVTMVSHDSSGFRPELTPPPALNISAREPPQVGANGEVVLDRGITDGLRIKALPNLDASVDGSSLYVNGHLEKTFDGQTVTLNNNLSSYGGDASVQGSAVLVGGDQEPRLILVRGKKLSVDPGHVVINGKAHREGYIAEPPDYYMAPYKVPVGKYFMMGDNRNDSNDSHQWGPLDGWRIIGRAEAIFWPLPRIRLIRTH